MKSLFLAVAFWLGFTSLALAQNPQCPTRPPGDSTNACASTAFVTGGIAASAITALTGDATATGPGSVPLTLATVNSNVGSFGNATNCVSFTTNGKGLITAASSVVCTPDFSSLTGRGTLAQLPQGIANSIWINPTGSTANMQNIAVPACANDGAHALVYVNGTGLVCGTITSAGGTVTTAGTGLTLTGGGTTLNLALNSQVLQASAGNPTGTASTTQVMMGMGSTCHLTPTYSSRIQIDFEGTVTNNTAGNTTLMNVRIGTGTAPANAAAITGTALLNTVSSGGGVGAIESPSFHLSAIATGLTPGTAYWADMSIGASANSSTISNMNCSLKEVL